MQKAFLGLGHVKSFRNNYLALVTATVLSILCTSASAQYDSTKTLQAQSSYGFSWKNADFLSTLGIPRDTLKLAVKDSGRIAYKGMAMWMYNGYRWVPSSSGSVVSPAAGVDSLSWHNSVLCWWKSNTPECYDFRHLICFTVLNFDQTKYVGYNCNGEPVDSVARPVTKAYPGHAISITDTLEDGKLFSVVEDSLAGGGGGGGSQDLQSVTDLGFHTTHNIISELGYNVQNPVGTGYVYLTDTTTTLNAGVVGISKGAAPGFDDRGAIQFVDFGARYLFLTVDSISAAGTGQSTIKLPVGDGRLVTKVNGIDPDINGNVDISGGGGGASTASNGLTLVGSDAQLGGTLSANTSIETGASTLAITSSTPSVNPFSVTADGTALVTTSASGNGFQSSSTSGQAGLMWINPSSTNTIGTILTIQRKTSGTAANGIGGALVFQTEGSTGLSQTSNQVISKWTNATSASRTSQLDILGTNNAASETYANFQTGGIVRVNNLADTLATKAYARTVIVGGRPLRIINVADYGAVGDSITDNTLAIQAAYNAVNDSTTIVYFPAGKYLISDTILITKTCKTIGSGGIMMYKSIADVQGASTEIIQTNNTKSGFVVNIGRCEFEDIAITQRSASDPTSTSIGIKMNSGTGFRMRNMSIARFYMNINLIAAAYYTMDGVSLFFPYVYNMRIGMEGTDGGDGSISNCFFYGGRFTTMEAHIYQAGGGGLKVVHNKFQNLTSNGDTTYYPTGMIDIEQSAPGSSILIIADNSLEGWKTTGIKVRNSVGAVFGSIIINNNQTNSYSVTPGSHIDISGIATSYLTSVSVTNNVITTSTNDSAAIKFDYVSKGVIDGNIVSGTNKYKVTNTLGVSTLEKSTAGVELLESSITNPRGLILTQNSGAFTSPSLMIFQKARGTFSAPTAVASGDFPGWIIAAGYDGASYIQSAGINFKVNGTVATGSVPMEIGFYTGTSTLGTQRAIIQSGGNFGIATTSPTSLFSVGSSSQFQVNTSGDIVKLNNITTTFPSSQGGANTFLKNNGSGTLTWANPSDAFTTNLVTPLLIGGSGTTQTLSLKPTSGVGATGADIIYQVGNNGATEAGRVLNNGTTTIGNEGATLGNLSLLSTLNVVAPNSSTIGISTIQRAANATFAGAGIIAYQDANVAVTNTTRLGYFGFGGATGTTHAYIRPIMIEGWAAQDYTTSNGGSYMTISTTPLNSVTRVEAWRVASNGALSNTQANGTDKLEVSGNIALMTAGNKLKITEGSNGSVGQTTLVAGTKAVTISGLTTSSRAIIQFVSAGGTVTTTWQYAAVCTANTLTITALTNAAATNTSDTSVLNYFIIN